MSDRFQISSTQEIHKVNWVKPAVSKIKAGSAEVNSGNLDDGDSGSALNNS